MRPSSTRSTCGVGGDLLQPVGNHRRGLAGQDGLLRTENSGARVPV